MSRNINNRNDAYGYRHDNQNARRNVKNIDNESVEYDNDYKQYGSRARNERVFFSGNRMNERVEAIDNHLPWYLKHVEDADARSSSDYNHVSKLKYEHKQQSNFNVGKSKIFKGSFDTDSRQVEQFNRPISSQYSDDEHRPYLDAQFIFHNNSNLNSIYDETETIILLNETNEYCLSRHEYANPRDKNEIYQYENQKVTETNIPYHLLYSNLIEQYDLLDFPNSPDSFQKTKEYPIFRGSFSYFDEPNLKEILIGREHFLHANLNQFFSADIDFPIWTILLSMILLKCLRVFFYICLPNDEKKSSKSLPFTHLFISKIRWCKPSFPLSFKLIVSKGALNFRQNPNDNKNGNDVIANQNVFQKSEKTNIFSNNKNDQNSSILQDKKNPLQVILDKESYSKYEDTDKDDKSSKKCLPYSPSLSISSKSPQSSYQSSPLPLSTKQNSILLDCTPQKQKSNSIVIKEITRNCLLPPDTISLYEDKHEYDTNAETLIMDKVQKTPQPHIFQARVESLTQLVSSTGLDRKSSLKLANASLLRCLELEFKMIEDEKKIQTEKELQKIETAKKIELATYRAIVMRIIQSKYIVKCFGVLYASKTLLKNPIFLSLFLSLFDGSNINRKNAVILIAEQVCGCSVNKTPIGAASLPLTSISGTLSPYLLNHSWIDSALPYFSSFSLSQVYNQLLLMTCWTSCIFRWLGRFLLLLVYHYILDKLRCPVLIHQMSNFVVAVLFFLSGDITEDDTLEEILSSFVYISFINCSLHVAGFKFLQHMESMKDADLQYITKRCRTCGRALSLGPPLLALLLGIGPYMFVDVLKYSIHSIVR